MRSKIKNLIRRSPQINDTNKTNIISNSIDTIVQLEVTLNQH
jgi:hypothetical protein